jgi:hypothetical protein
VLPSPIVSDKQINSITTVGGEEEGELTSVGGEPLAGPAGQGGGGGGAQQQLTSVHQAARHAGTQRLTQHIHCKFTDLGSENFVLKQSTTFHCCGSGMFFYPGSADPNFSNPDPDPHQSIFNTKNCF